MALVRPVLLDYFGRHEPKELIGQSAAIHFALVPLLLDKTRIPFNLTIDWVVRRGRSLCPHEESVIRRFLQDKQAAWRREGLPFHLWLTSPAGEVLDVTFSMNLGWANTREECDQLISLPIRASLGERSPQSHHFGGAGLFFHKRKWWRSHRWILTVFRECLPNHATSER